MRTKNIQYSIRKEERHLLAKRAASYALEHMGWMDTLETSPCWLCQTDLITSASRRACVNTLMIAQMPSQTITLIYSVTKKTIVVSGKAGVCFCLLFVSHSYTVPLCVCCFMSGLHSAKGEESGLVRHR